MLRLLILLLSHKHDSDLHILEKFQDHVILSMTRFSPQPSCGAEYFPEPTPLSTSLCSNVRSYSNIHLCMHISFAISFLLPKTAPVLSQLPTPLLSFVSNFIKFALVLQSFVPVQNLKPPLALVGSLCPCFIKHLPYLACVVIKKKTICFIYSCSASISIVLYAFRFLMHTSSLVCWRLQDNTTNVYRS